MGWLQNEKSTICLVDGAPGIASALLSFCFIGVAYYFTDHAGLEKYQLEGVSSLL